MNAIAARGLIAAIVVLAATLVAAEDRASDEIVSEEMIRLKDAPGRDLAASRCTVCHSLDYIHMNAPVMDRTGWEKSVHKMIERFGAPISSDEARRIVEYLSTNYSATP